MGRTPSIVPKWRVRYVRDRMAGLSGSGDRGADRKYGLVMIGEGGRIFLLDDAVSGAGTGGFTTLFAALNVGTGEVMGRHYKRRRHLAMGEDQTKVVLAHLIWA